MAPTAPAASPNRPVPIEPLDFTDCRLATAEPDADWELAISQGGPAVGLSSRCRRSAMCCPPNRCARSSRYLRGFCKETGWPTGNLNLPRPIFTEKAFPENEFIIAPVASHDPHDFTEFSLKAIYERRIGPACGVRSGRCRSNRSARGPRLTGWAMSESGSSTRSRRARRAISSRAGTDLAFGTGQESEIAGTSRRGVRAVPCGRDRRRVSRTCRASSRWSFRSGSSVADSRDAVYHVYRRPRHEQRSGYLDARRGVQRRKSRARLDAADSKGTDTNRGARRGPRRDRAAQRAKTSEAINGWGISLWEYLEPVLSRR